MIQHLTREIVWFQFKSFIQQKALVTHGIFSRHGGVSLPPFDSLNAGPATPDIPSLRLENYRRIHETLPGRPLLVGTKLEQGTVVREIVVEDVEGAPSPIIILPDSCDAFITKLGGIGIFWAVADCAVILLLDPTNKAIELTHAGWRGTAGAILRNTINAMQVQFGTKTSDLLAAIAPSVGPCCFEVDDQMRQAFESDPLDKQTAEFSSN